LAGAFNPLFRNRKSQGDLSVGKKHDAVFLNHKFEIVKQFRRARINGFGSLRIEASEAFKS